MLETGHRYQIQPRHSEMSITRMMGYIKLFSKHVKRCLESMWFCFGPTASRCCRFVVSSPVKSIERRLECHQFDICTYDMCHVMCDSRYGASPPGQARAPGSSASLETSTEARGHHQARQRSGQNWHYCKKDQRRDVVVILLANDALAAAMFHDLKPSRSQ